jgi:hypothetical protein
MSTRTPVFVICSPLERVGKTFIARLLAEFFVADGRRVECFDLGGGHPSLVDYLPDRTILSTVGDTQGQMAVFDRLIQADATPKVVDLGHGAFERFFTLVGQVGFAEEAQRHGVQVVVLFVTSPSPLAARAYAALQHWLPGLILVPVQNEALGRSFAAAEFPASGGASLSLRIPQLATGLHRIVLPPSFSFADFRLGKMTNISEGYRSELESWVRRVFVEFRELELRLLLATLRLSLQP